MRPLAELPDALDYVVYGSVPWDRAWLTERNLAHALGRRSRVLYVEPPVTPLMPLRHGLSAWTWPTLRSLARRRPRRVGRVHVYRPVVLPPRTSSAARALSAPLLAQQVRRAAGRVGLSRPVVIAAQYVPGAVGALDERFRVYLVKDWIAAGSSLLSRPEHVLAAERDEMCRTADLVCAISPALNQSLARIGVESVLLRHGFHADLAGRYEDPVPHELERLPRPLLGYTGSINGRLDFELLAQLADRFVDGSLTLIGEVSGRSDRARLEPLLRRPNVHLLGHKARAELPAYVAALDCALLPYADTEWVRHQSPLKLWDYLYAGAPIVGSGCLALRDFPPPLARFATSAAEFVRFVEEELADGAAGRDARRAFALRNGWDSRADELERLIVAQLGGAADRMAARAPAEAFGAARVETRLERDVA